MKDVNERRSRATGYDRPLIPLQKSEVESASN